MLDRYLTGCEDECLKILYPVVGSRAGDFLSSILRRGQDLSSRYKSLDNHDQVLADSRAAYGLSPRV